MEYKNILLIKMSSLGDILHTLPFAAALRQRFPKAKITWLVHPQFAGFSLFFLAANDPGEFHSRAFEPH